VEGITPEKAVQIYESSRAYVAEKKKKEQEKLAAEAASAPTAEPSQEPAPGSEPEA
jgi:hypothetical protein